MVTGGSAPGLVPNWRCVTSRASPTPINWTDFHLAIAAGGVDHGDNAPPRLG